MSFFCGTEILSSYGNFEYLYRLFYLKARLKFQQTLGVSTPMITRNGWINIPANVIENVIDEQNHGAPLDRKSVILQGHGSFLEAIFSERVTANR